MACTEPFSPCKGLSAVSFVNGCWLVNTIWRPSVDWEISHHRKTKQNRPKIKLWWMISEAEEGQNTARAMWEDSERGLLFARIKPKHFLY